MKYLIMPDKFPIEGDVIGIRKVLTKSRCEFCGEGHVEAEIRVQVSGGQEYALTRNQTLVLDTPDNSE